MQGNNTMKVSEELSHPDRNSDTLQESQGLNQCIKNFMGYFAKAKEKLEQKGKLLCLILKQYLGR